MREYLIYKMRSENVSRDEICSLLNVSEKTFRNKLSGRTDFNWSECKAIKNTFFPDEEYEMLFENAAHH